MPTVEERQVASLVFFVRDRWQADVYAISAQKKDLREAADYNALAFLETFLWLHLGVQVDYFSKDLSRQLVREHFKLLDAAYERAVAGKHHERFALPLQQILRAELSRRRDVSTWFEQPLKSPRNLASAFQTALLLCNGFAQDPDAYALVQALVFADSTKWDAVVKLTQSTAPLPRAPTASEGDVAEPLKEQILTGFFRAVEHMEAYHEMVADFDRASLSEMPFLKERTRDLQHWRLDFRNKIVEERFLQIAGIVKAVLTPTLARTPPPPGETPDADKATSTLMEGIRVLMREWEPLSKGVAR